MCSLHAEMGDKVLSSITTENVEDLFFSIYATIPAFTIEATRSGQGIRIFHESRAKLESQIRQTKHVKGSGKDEQPRVPKDEVPVLHSLLSLILWLYPNSPGYNRLRNASSMLSHAEQTTSNSTTRTSQSEALAVGLFIKLRILPFLIRSKKVAQEEIGAARSEALKVLDEIQLGGQTEKLGIAGLLFDALGFSYYQLERDRRNAISFFNKSVDALTTFLGQPVGTSFLNENSATKSIRTFYDAITAVACCDLGICYESEAENKEGQEMLSYLRVTRTHYEKAYEYAKVTPWHFYKGLSAYNLSGTFWKEGEIQIEKEKTRELLKKAIDLGEQALRWFSLWSNYESDFLGGSWIATYYQRLARNSPPAEEKRLMIRAEKLALKAEAVVEQVKSLRWSLANLGDIYFSNASYFRTVAAKSRFSSKGVQEDVLDELNKALSNCLKSKSFYRDDRHINRAVDSSLLGADICYDLLNVGAGSSKLDQKELGRYARLARRLCNGAIKLSAKNGWNEHIAEANWHLAQVLDREGRFEKAAHHYELANVSYQSAMSTAAVRTRYYQELSYFMQARNRVEKAKSAHRKSKFSAASNLYQEASDFLSRSRRWGYSSQLYLAESLIEKGEEESNADKQQDSVTSFSGAFKSLSNFAEELKNESEEEKFLNGKVAQELSVYCNARIILEKSKIAYRLGDLEKSTNGLSQSGAMLAELARDSLISDPSRSNELDTLSSMCRALESFQKAQISGNSNLFLEARQIFSDAAARSLSKSLKPLLLGLANFAEFLQMSKKIEQSLETNFDIELIVRCDKAIDEAEQLFRRLKYKSYLSLLKASKHILDATIKMSAAEREVSDTEEKARLYEEAQKSLSLASRYYESLGSSKRVKESLRMIGAVRNHQRLIPLAHDIIAEIASNQIIYSAISSSSVFERSPESSASVLSSAYIILDGEIDRHVVCVGETFSFTLTLSNLGKESAITVRIDEIIPEGFEIIDCPYPASSQRTINLNLKIGPSEPKQVRIHARATSSGEFSWHPSLVYVDSTSKEYKISKPLTCKIAVEAASASEKIAQMFSEKEKLELKLSEILRREKEVPASTVDDEIYSLKEKISNIEEAFLRTKHEYISMSSELERVKGELVSFASSKDSSVNDIKMRNELEIQEKILVDRIERRRRLLEQIHML